MIKRDIEESVREAAQYFYAIAIVGPRQSGKTTLAQQMFPNHTYVSLEDLDSRLMANSDPRSFLNDYPSEHGLILDEIQHAPALLSYMQTIIDREKKPGYFIVTGSQNILVNEAITQTLAGRIAIITLLPLSIHELEKASLLPTKIEDLIFNGSYPRLFVEKSLKPSLFYSNYIRSYLERDVRQLKNIFDLNIFQKFVQLCAGRVGQELNYSSLSNDCGIDHKTAKAWIPLLEATYVIFLLQPYYKNFGKRLIRSPKLYFVDTGIACALLNIKSPEELALHFAKGALVESLIIGDFFKQEYNRNNRPSLYFWRDHQGNEVDCLVEKALTLTPIEIKSSKTISLDFFKQFNYLKTIEAFPVAHNYLIYTGDSDNTVKDTSIIRWQQAGNLIKKL